MTDKFYLFKSAKEARQFAGDHVEPVGCVVDPERITGGLSPGEKGAAAGRKLREQLIKLGEASEKSNQELYKLGVTINMSIPHNPSKIKRFLRWILAKMRGDIPTSYTDSRGNIYKGWAKCGEIKKISKSLYVEPVKRECKSCGEAIQCGAGTSHYWWCDAGYWHGKPLENVVDFANSISCPDFKLKDSLREDPIKTQRDREKALRRSL